MFQPLVTLTTLAVAPLLAAAVATSTPEDGACTEAQADTVALAAIGDPETPSREAIARLVAAAEARAKAAQARAEATELDVLRARLNEIATDIEEKATFNVTISDGKQVVTITKADGDLKATIDGKDVPASRISEKDGTIVIKDAGGKVIQSVPLRVGQMGQDAFAIAFGDGDENLVFEGVDLGNADRIWERFGGEIARVAPGRPLDGFARFVDESAGETPTVMLGVHMDGASDVLASQLGIDADEVTVITGVLEGLPADEGGIRPFDVIVAIDGEVPADRESIRAVLRGLEDGDEIEFSVIRRGNRRDVIVRLEEWDGNRMAAADLEGRTATSTVTEGANVFFGGAEGDRWPVAVAPMLEGREGDDREVAILRRPTRWGFEVPNAGGGIALDGSVMAELKELRGMKDEILQDMQIELRRELPKIMIELERSGGLTIPNAAEMLKLREMAPNVQAEVLRVIPQIKARVQGLEPELAPLIAEIEGLRQFEILEDVDSGKMLGVIIDAMKDGDGEGGVFKFRVGDDGDVDVDTDVAIEVEGFPLGDVEIAEIIEKARPGGGNRLGNLERRMERIERMLKDLLERSNERE